MASYSLLLGGMNVTGWLSGWLRDIVLIILFAAFVDLLIPNNSLQRYVKVAISLMILLTILSPIITLFKSDLDIRHAAEQAMGTVQGEIPPLAEVMEAGGRLRMDADSRSARLVEAQMEEMIAERINTELNAYAERVDVRISPSEQEGSTAEVKEIRITLDEQPTDAASRADASRKGVAEVEPVVPVTVDITLQDQPGTDENIRYTEASESPEREQTRAQIKRLMRQWWGIAERAVYVEWTEVQGGSSGGMEGGERS